MMDALQHSFCVDRSLNIVGLARLLSDEMESHAFNGDCANLSCAYGALADAARALSEFLGDL